MLDGINILLPKKVAHGDEVLTATYKDTSEQALLLVEHPFVAVLQQHNSHRYVPDVVPELICCTLSTWSKAMEDFPVILFLWISKLSWNERIANCMHVKESFIDCFYW